MWTCCFKNDWLTFFIFLVVGDFIHLNDGDKVEQGFANKKSEVPVPPFTSVYTSNQLSSNSLPYLI